MHQKQKQVFTQHLFITNPKAFYEGDFRYCFSIYADTNPLDGWAYAGPITFELDVDFLKDKCKDACLDIIEKEEAKHTAALVELERKRRELLALPAPPAIEESPMPKSVGTKNDPGFDVPF